MSFKPNDTLTVEFDTCASTGALTNADSLPVGILSQNGTDDGTVTVTVTNKATGRYKAVCTIPVGYAAGDRITLHIAATISTIAAGQTYGPFVLDSKRWSDVIGAQIPTASAGTSTGLLISGANTGPASISGGFTFSNSGGDALTLTSSGGNGSGLNASGNGTGHGLKSTGGATGRGIYALGGATSGSGIRAEAQGGTSHGFHGLGFGAGSGFDLDAGLTGAGLVVNGGGTSGAGISVATTSGDGISVTPTAGNALTLTANGTSKHGALITGGTAGTSDGLKAVAGTGGVDVRGNITGSITGSLSGSAGSVTGNVGGSVASVTGAVGSVTGNVGGNVVGSVGSVTAGVTVTTNNDKAGYSLTQAFPTNFSSLAITVGGAVTAGTVSDKSGYSLSGTQSFNNSGQTTKLAATLAAADVTGNVPADLQTIKTQLVTATAGFSYDAQTTSQGTIATNLNATVSSRLAASAYTAPDNTDIVAALAAAQAAAHDAAGLLLIFGGLLNVDQNQFLAFALANGPGGTGSDPLANLPSHYGPGTTGALIANLDVPVSSRATLAGSGPDVCTLGPFTDSVSGRPLAGGMVWVTRNADGAGEECGPLKTDASGTVKANLTDGAQYYLFFEKTGENSIVAQLFTARKD